MSACSAVPGKAVAEVVAAQGSLLRRPMQWFPRRVPLREKDELKSFRGSRHVAVIRGNKIYRVEALDEDWL